jgi:hypothetical protein
MPITVYRGDLDLSFQLYVASLTCPFLLKHMLHPSPHVVFERYEKQGLDRIDVTNDSHNFLT